jgi:hypothetical protein
MSPISQEQQCALDERLRQLAIAAQQQPIKSRGRQKALSQLIYVLQQSGSLVRPRRDQFQSSYGEIYAEALQRLFAYMCEKINNYDPQRGEVLQWVNFLLNRQFFIEASRELLPTVYKGLDPKSIKRLSLEDLDYSNPSEVNPQLLPLPSQQVLQCLEEDPEGSFQSSHIVNYPTATFQTIAIKRLQGYSWQEMSAELGIQVSTLSSFYQRCLTKFAPQLKEYLS